MMYLFPVIGSLLSYAAVSSVIYGIHDGEPTFIWIGLVAAIVLFLYAYLCEREKRKEILYGAQSNTKRPDLFPFVGIAPFLVFGILKALNFSFGISLLIIILGFILGLASGGTMDKFKMPKLDKAIQDKRNEQQALAVKKAKEQLYKTFYVKCKENGIVTTETDEEKKSLLLLAKNVGIQTLDEALLAFEEGKCMDEKAQQAKLAEENKKKKIQQQEASDWINREHRNAYNDSTTLTGKKKYFLPCITYLETIRRYIERHSNESSGLSYVRPQKEDWAVLGGIATGIGGPIAGAIAASEAQIRNAENVAHAEATNANIAKINALTSMYGPAQTFYQSDLEDCEAYCKWLDGKLNDILIDDLDQTGLANYVDLKVEDYTISTTGRMLIELSSSVKDGYTILGKEARIDGYYRVDVYRGDVCIGDACYTPFGKGKINLTKVGFGSEQKCSVWARPKGDNVPFAEGETYTFKFVPLTLWGIEAVNLSNYNFKSNTIRRQFTL